MGTSAMSSPPSSMSMASPASSWANAWEKERTRWWRCCEWPTLLLEVCNDEDVLWAASTKRNHMSWKRQALMLPESLSWTPICMQCNKAVDHTLLVYSD
jgi:hypothetical protein